MPSSLPPEPAWLARLCARRPPHCRQPVLHPSRTCQLPGRIAPRPQGQPGIICTYIICRNEALKSKVNPHMLANQLRFNDEIKKYGGYVYNAKHAAKLLEAVKSVSASDEQYIANVEIDEAVFENAKPCDIAMIESIMVEDKEKIGFGGSTFAWKDKLKVLGFKYDPEYQLWLIETTEPRPRWPSRQDGGLRLPP